MNAVADQSGGYCVQCIYPSKNLMKPMQEYELSLQKVKSQDNESWRKRTRKRGVEVKKQAGRMRKKY
jgi:hypothetical protein